MDAREGPTLQLQKEKRTRQLDETHRDSNRLVTPGVAADRNYSQQPGLSEPSCKNVLHKALCREYALSVIKN